MKRCNLGVMVVASGGKDSGRRGEGMGEAGTEEADMLRMAVRLTVTCVVNGMKRRSSKHGYMGKTKDEESCVRGWALLI